MVAVAAIATRGGTVCGQDTQPTIKNGGMESSKPNGMPSRWSLDSRKGFQYSLDKNNPGEGEQSLLVDSTTLTNDSEWMTASGKQKFSASPWRGKRLKFTASVRTDQLQGPARVQLFVGCSIGGGGLLGNMMSTERSLDDMADRPIRNTEWGKYSVIVDIPEEASRVVVGWKLIGVGKAWIDNLSVVEVGEEEDVTSAEPNQLEQASDDDPEAQALIEKASWTSHLAPKQPFFNHWLWLAALSVVLFSVSSLIALAPSDSSSELLDGQDLQRPNLGMVQKCAFRFSLVYWVLFIFTVPFLGYLQEAAKWVNVYYQPAADFLIEWVAIHWFGIEEELTPPLGSGDTTSSYLQLLVRFGLSVVIATLWSLVDWRRTDYRLTRDLFHTYLRYCLATSLLVYAIIKIKWSTNQFPALSGYHYDRTWGDSSPMGALWTFMGASRPYTVFAGGGELVGGLLLLFRRTSLLGALVGVGVMTNVVMLNFCYDVPVKIFSVHLTMMGLMILMGYAGTLRALLFCKPRPSFELKPAFFGPRTRWFGYLLKATFIGLGVVMPFWTHTVGEVDYFRQRAQLPDWLGVYSVREFKLDGEIVTQKTHKAVWKQATFSEVTRWSSLEGRAACELSLRPRNQMVPTAGFSRAESGDWLMLLSEFPTFPQGDFSVAVIDEKKIKLTGISLAGNIEVTLSKRAEKKYLLRDRGFRWISEVPFSR